MFVLKLSLVILVAAECRSQCRDIKVASCGAPPKEALDNLHEAIKLWQKNAEFLGI
ncbi:hypothetical protein [Methanospirillum sp.]